MRQHSVGSGNVGWSGIAVVVALAACGGGASEGRGVQESKGGSSSEKGEARASDKEQISPEQGIPPEKLDEVQALFRRKTMQATGCYNSALEDLDSGKRKGHQGDVTLSMTLGTDGKATQVKVERATLDLPQVGDCLVEQVKGWSFPELPQKAFFNWTFNFKPAY